MHEKNRGRKISCIKISNHDFCMDVSYSCMKMKLPCMNMKFPCMKIREIHPLLLSDENVTFRTWALRLQTSYHHRQTTIIWHRACEKVTSINLKSTLNAIIDWAFFLKVVLEFNINPTFYDNVFRNSKHTNKILRNQSSMQWSYAVVLTRFPVLNINLL